MTNAGMLVTVEHSVIMRLTLKRHITVNITANIITPVSTANMSNMVVQSIMCTMEIIMETVVTHITCTMWLLIPAILLHMNIRKLDKDTFQEEEEHCTLIWA